MLSSQCIALLLVLLGQSQAYPILKSSKRPLQSTWLDLFAPEGAIRKDRLEKFPLYEYVYEDIDYGEQIWSDCGSASDIVKIDSVYINPSPPQRGESFSVSAKVTLSEQVSSGYVNIHVHFKKYNLNIPMVSKTMSLCAMLSYLGLSCPLAAGTHELSYSQTFPSYAPSGRYVGMVTAADNYGNQLACVEIDMTVTT